MTRLKKLKKGFCSILKWFEPISSAFIQILKRIFWIHALQEEIVFD